MPQLIKICAKIYVGKARTEWLWAKKISDNTAKVENIPFFVEDMTLGDLVEFDPKTHVILRVIEKCGRTLHGHFDFAEYEEETLQLWHQIKEHFGTYDIPLEAMSQGFFSLAVPLDLDDEQVLGVAVCCPVPVTLLYD